MDGNTIPGTSPDWSTAAYPPAVHPHPAKPPASVKGAKGAKGVKSPGTPKTDKAGVAEASAANRPPPSLKPSHSPPAPAPASPVGGAPPASVPPSREEVAQENERAALSSDPSLPQGDPLRHLSQHLRSRRLLLGKAIRAYGAQSAPPPSED